MKCVLLMVLFLPTMFIKAGIKGDSIIIDNQVGHSIDIQWYGNPSGELDILPVGRSERSALFSRFVASYIEDGVYVHTGWIIVIPGKTYVFKKGMQPKTLVVTGDFVSAAVSDE